LFFPPAKLEKFHDDPNDNPAIKQLRLALRSMLAGYNLPVCEWENYLHHFFNELDSDGSKDLDIVEFEKMLLSMDIILMPEKIRSAFDTVDTNKSETISYNELFNVIFPSFQKL
jgi:Ca2+-binding EF-hand superfamily protein